MSSKSPKHLERLAKLTILLIVSTVIAVTSGKPVFAADHYVHPNGDDSNPGTISQPWKTISFACLQLQPGDRLRVARERFRREGEILLRFVDPVTFEYLPLEGSPTQVTRLLPYGPGDELPKIDGQFDIRGSHIRLQQLEIIGDQTSTRPGVGVYESHNVTIAACRVQRHGGGGINFNHCDLVYAVNNVVYKNATANPDQHSGISSYQPINRVPNSTLKYGVLFRGNRCFSNRNTVPPNGSSSVTDGNGIIIDDHRYTQFNDIIAGAMMSMGEQGASSGSPFVGTDNEGNPLGYSRSSLVLANTCYFNGGRGFHVFTSDLVDVLMNRAFSNLDSADLTVGLPRDESGVPFFFNGEFSCVDSSEVTFRFNIGFSDQAEAAAASEHFFDNVPADLISPNRWSNNQFENSVDLTRNVNVFNVNESELLDGE